MKIKTLIILFFIACFLFPSCKLFTRVTGISTPAGKIKNNATFDKFARLDLDSSTCMFMDQEIFLRRCPFSYQLLLDSAYIEIHNDTIVVSAKNTETTIYKIYDCFGDKLSGREGVQIYDPIKKRYHNKIVYERFYYNYGYLASGAGWQYRIKGTDLIFSRRFKWIS
jgi:hypothetical protein